MDTTSPDKSHSDLAERVIAHLQQERWFAYALISPQLTVIQASPSLQDLLVDPEPGIFGQPLAEVLYEFAGAEEALHKVLRGEIPGFWLEQVNRELPDLSTFYYDFQVIPLDVNHLESGLLLVVLDTTRASRLEQQLVQDRNELRLARAELERANAELHKLSDLKSIFLSIAAHDLRTPLAALRGYSDLILSDPPLGRSPDHAGFLATILSLVDQMDRLVADFLDLDQIEKGRLRVTPIRCDLNDIAQETVKVVKKLPESRDVSLVFIPTQPETPVLADTARLQQIFYNLLSNAVKYAPAGSEVLVKTWAGPGFGAVDIQDSGSGLNKEEIDHLFELYYRTPEAEASRVRGSGLGLYIVNSLVQALQGQILVTSQMGQGTTFSIRLPAFQFKD